MSGARVTVGDVEIVALLDGALSLPLGRVFPEASAADWAPYLEAYARTFAGEAWHVPIRCYLLRSPRSTILVDAGIGTSDEVARTWNVRGALGDALADAGVSPDEITTVVLTHRHVDHVGGVTGDEGRVTFRRARHLMHRADLEVARERARTSPFFDRTVLALERAGVLEAVEAERALDERITLLHTPGHTPGSVSVLVSSEGEGALLVGDAIHHPAQLAQPEWRDANDDHHARAAATRRALIDRIEAEGLTLGPSHFPEPFGGLVRVAGRRHWRPR